MMGPVDRETEQTGSLPNDGSSQPRSLASAPVPADRPGGGSQPQHVPALVLLDTEFTDLLDPRLLSLGLVSADGTDEHYVELDLQSDERARPAM